MAGRLLDTSFILFKLRKKKIQEVFILSVMTVVTHLVNRERWGCSEWRAHTSSTEGLVPVLPTIQLFLRDTQNSYFYVIITFKMLLFFNLLDFNILKTMGELMVYISINMSTGQIWLEAAILQLLFKSLGLTLAKPKGQKVNENIFVFDLPNYLPINSVFILLWSKELWYYNSNWSLLHKQNESFGKEWWFS